MTTTNVTNNDEKFLIQTEEVKKAQEESKSKEAEAEYNKMLNRIIIDNMVADIKKLDNLTGEAATDHMGYLIKKACSLGIEASKERIIELNTKIENLEKQVSFLKSANSNKCNEPITAEQLSRL